MTAAYILTEDGLKAELSAAERYFDCLDALRTVQGEREEKTKPRVIR
jgi:hypothetical protein